MSTSHHILNRSGRRWGGTDLDWRDHFSLPDENIDPRSDEHQQNKYS